MAKPAVGSMSEWSGVLKDFFRQIDDGSISLEEVKAFNEHRNPFEVASASFAEALISHTAQLLSKKFSCAVGVDPLPPEFTEDNLTKWGRFNLQPVFFPDEEITEDRKLKVWTKPEAWFYQKIRDGKIKSDSAQLHQGWYLADFTGGADYTDGSQVFQNDPLAPVIQRLREEGKIGKYDHTPLGSRFTITNDEWRNTVCPAIAEELGFKPEQVRLERAVEFNAIGNVYDPNRGQFNAWEWFDDSFGDSDRLVGGDRGGGGLADVRSRGSGSRRGGLVAGRPLVSFVS